MDELDAFKQNQREGWAHFAPLEIITTPPAARLVRFARVRADDGVLDVACGTGVVAVTAARLGARVSRIFALVAAYAPPPPPGVSPPPQWGDPGIIRERLGDKVTRLRFDRATMTVPVLSPQHQLATAQRTGPVRKLVEMLKAHDPARLEAFRREYVATIAEYVNDNVLQQHYLMTRATKI